jgi:hypothetical protein
LPHPYKNRGLISKNIIENVDILEVKNGRIKPELNERALELAKKTNLPGIGGSDAHLAREIGTIQTVFSNSSINNLEDVSKFRKLINTNRPTITGNESPRNVHYFSVVIGNLRKKQPIQLGRSIVTKIKSKQYCF